jgi:hypothetical protein
MSAQHNFWDDISDLRIELDLKRMYIHHLNS